MSFSTLPPELQEGIIVDLPKATLASLCLVSRSTLPLARPLLYRSVVIDLSSWTLFDIHRDQGFATQESERSGDGVAQQDDNLSATAQNPSARLYETLKAHPDYCSYVKEIHFDLRVLVPREIPRALQLLASCSSLRKLEVLDYETTGLDDETCNLIIDSCPRTVTLLDISLDNMSLNVIFGLLQQIPLLEIFCIQPVNEATFHPSRLVSITSPLVLHCLRTPKLQEFTQDHSFVDAIFEASPNLSSVEVDLASLQALNPGLLSAVRLLKILDAIAPSLRTTHPELDPAHFFPRFSSTLAACTSLRSFAIDNTLGRYLPEDVPQLEAHRILHRLPPSLRNLELDGVQFTTPYLLDFLSLRTTTLSCLGLQRIVKSYNRATDTKIYDTEAEEKVVEVCQKRNISLVWIGGREVDA
ncbi:hypothetical protein JCM16303_007166 [Sporobolomyces ruberrimus]